MNITINGNKKEIENINNVRELLGFLLETDRGIIVELNGEIVHRDHWEERPVREGDDVELIQFIGGG